MSHATRAPRGTPTRALALACALLVACPGKLLNPERFVDATSEASVADDAGPRDGTLAADARPAPVDVPTTPIDAARTDATAPAADAPRDATTPRDAPMATDGASADGPRPDGAPIDVAADVRPSVDVPVTDGARTDAGSDVPADARTDSTAPDARSDARPDSTALDEGAPGEDAGEDTGPDGATRDAGSGSGGDAENDGT